MTTPAELDNIHWHLFEQVEHMIKIERSQEALDLLYYLEIQELPFALRVQVNTSLAMRDPEPMFWQKKEWLEEARYVLRDLQSLPTIDDDDEALKAYLGEKLRAAQVAIYGYDEYGDQDFDEDRSYVDEDEEYRDDMDEDMDEDEEMDDAPAKNNQDDEAANDKANGGKENGKP